MSEWNREDGDMGVRRIYSARATEPDARDTAAPQERAFAPQAPLDADEAPAPRGRRRRAAAVSQAFAPNGADGGAAFDSHEVSKPEEPFASNEETEAVLPEAPAAPAPEYSPYARRDDAPGDTDAAEPTYAPPTKLSFYGADYEPWPEDTPDDPAAPSANVYRPREATWADTARQAALSSDSVGYQVRDEEPEEAPTHARRKRHGARNALIALAVLALLGGAGYYFREPLVQAYQKLAGTPQPTTEAPFAVVVTPAPVKGYDPSIQLEVSDEAKREIDAIAGVVDMETVAVTESNVLMRSPREDGRYDFYLFTAGGELVSYYEGLGRLDVVPLEDGGFYVRQAPYLVTADGKAMIALSGLESSVRKTLKLKQMLGGWAIVCDMDEQSFNYMNAEGQLLSTLWFSRAYPFTGNATVAYVDTGALGSDERYMLYVLSSDGTMTKFSESAEMDGVVASACGAAYMSDGSLYLLSAPDAPFATTSDVAFYPDCDAMVVREAATGKYGLIVHGEKHYDFLYDEVKPVECDMEWARKTYGADGGKATLCLVTDAGYPQPLTHYFELIRDGQTEYVALSATTNSPILPDEQP